jgi:antitoxin component YwqK of YwqJK toxin-antitoxin module
MAEKIVLEKMGNLPYIDINIIPIVESYIYETKTTLRKVYVGLGTFTIKMILKYRTRYGIKDGPYNEYPSKKFIIDNNDLCLIEKGNYINGKLDGKKVRKRISGKIFREEHYKQGKKHGIFKEYDEQGNLTHQDEYNNDKLVGESLWFYPTGIIRERWTYICEDREECRIYWENGQLYKVSYIGEKSNGEVKEWYDNGNIMSITLYNKGEIVDEQRYYKDGKPMKKVGNVMWI